MDLRTNLLEFWNSHEIEAIWFVSIAHPAGKDLIHDTQTQDSENYCDINAAINFLGDLDQYTGHLFHGDNMWQWDGNSGKPQDGTQSTILNLKVFAKSNTT